MAGIRENLSLETWTILGALVSRIEHTPSFTCINSCDFHYPGKLNSEKQIMLQFLNRHQISLCFKIRICLKIMISVRFPEGKINIFSILNLPIIPFSGHLFGKILICGKCGDPMKQPSCWRCNGPIHWHLKGQTWSALECHFLRSSWPKLNIS